MPKVTLNFENVTSGMEPLPRGIYPATLFEVKSGTSKSSNKPMLSLTFKIQYPPEYSNRQAWTNLSLQPQALWRVKEVLIALGVAPEELKTEVEVDWDDLLGAECRLQIDHRIYDGKVRQETSKILAPAASPEDGYEPMAAADLDVSEV